MLISIIIVVLVAVIISLYRYLTTKPSALSVWRSAITIGFSVGIARAALACLGWYTVAHTGGPLQISGFFLAMLAWPEAVVFGRHKGIVPLQFYIHLGFLLIVTSLLLCCALALAVQVSRRQRTTARTSRNETRRV
jgi:hypothetical protein